MKRSLFAAVLILTPVFAAEGPEHSKRIQEASTVLTEIMGAPDQGVPSELLEKAQCIGVIPDLKRVGFVVGAKFGKGVISCRTATGWSGPSTIRVEGGNIGLQIGAGETDVVFVVMNSRGMEKLMKDKFTIGGDASAMAGPVGRSAEAKTDALMHAEIVSYSRSRGVFAGVSLEGATLRADNEDNTKLYGRTLTQEQILHGTVPPPPDAKPFLDAINRFAPAHKEH